MSVGVIRGGFPAGSPLRRLLARDRQTLLLGVVDDGILPRLERRRGALPLVDRLALDGVALGVDVLVDRVPLPALVHGRGDGPVDLVDLLATVEVVRLGQPRVVL